MRLIVLMVLVMLLTGCVGGNPDRVVIVVTATSALTPDPSPDGRGEVTPTREVIVTNTPSATRTPGSIDCQTQAVRDGFYPINSNPCLRNLRLVDVNPASISNPDNDRMQWIPAGFDPYWQRGTVIDPYVFALSGGGFRHDIDYQDGGFGLSWFQEFERGKCYVLKLTVEFNIQPRNNAPLQNIQFTGRIISLSNSVQRVFTAQSPDRVSGRQEFIWTILAPEAAHMDLYTYIQWASFDGEIDWRAVEVLEPPAGTNYCGAGSVVF